MFLCTFLRRARQARSWIPLSVLWLAAAPLSSQAQVAVTAGGPAVTQNFNGMANTATASLPTGWKVDKQTTARALGSYAAAATATDQAGGASLSTAASNGIYNFGASAGATDRAVGGLSSSSASKTVNLYSPPLTNSGSSALSGLTVAYDVEKYRNGSNAAGFTLQLYYSTTGTSWTAAGGPFVTSLAADADNSGSATAPLATTPVTGTLNVAVPAGGTLYLAWSYAVTSGSTTSNAQALAVDNISLTPLGAAPAPPSVSGLAPGTGPVGTQLTISGSNLAGISGVTVGGVAATGVSATGTTVTATVDGSTPLGSQPVVLSDGTTTYAAGPFTVTAPVAPTLTSLAPTSGPVGTSVTLTGSGFTAGATVAFNGTAATAVQLVSPTQLTATVPAGASSGYVTVTTAGGAATSPGGFTVTRLPYSLFEEFNRADNAAVGNSWQETETAASGAVLAGGQLKLSSTTSGREFITRDVSARYSPILGSNSPMTWAWNMQQSRPNPSGFDAGNYGVAFVLAASSADLLTATGYAVVLGNSSTPDPVKLVRFAGGLGANARLTPIISTSTDYTNRPLTLRVTYDPATDQWTLAAGSNTTAFEDPGTASYTSLGTAFDDTYTNTALPYVGALWNHATAGADYALFDNLYLTAPCDLTAEPAAGPATVVADQLTSTTARLSYGAGTGSTRVVVLRAGQLPAATPVDGTTYRAAADLAAPSLLAPGEYLVGEGSGTRVDLTGLQPNTTYFYRLYDGDGAACATNYRATPSAEGSFATPPCALAALPTQPATQATATAASSYTLDLAWQAGDGAQRLVVLRAGQAPTGQPADGADYVANARFGSGTALAPDEFVVYLGTGSSVTVSGLTSSRTYYAAVYERNGAGCTARYLLAPATASAALPVAPPSAYRFYRGNLHAHSSYSDGNKDAATSGCLVRKYVDRFAVSPALC